MTAEAISTAQRNRLALVYIRQSSPQQVARNLESQRRQRGFVDRAVQLGWAANRIRVIDEDLGQSGARSGNRQGFQQMVAMAALGRIGIILALEVSRLARSNGDWYQLLDVCAVAGILIADEEGLYDPAAYNDRLLLGLKGTMSEAELHLIKQRLVEGARAKARRGELRRRLPVGFVWDQAGRIVKDPDQQVVVAIDEVFRRFRRVGTIGQTQLSLIEDGVEIPVRTEQGTLRWRRPSVGAVARMLKNPTYAGAYVYGRRQVEERLDGSLKPQKRMREVEQQRWHVLLKDHHEGYLSWEQFEHNQSQIRSNWRAPGEAGAPREGEGLLQGLVLCGHCGRRLHIAYGKGSKPTRYWCVQARRQSGEPTCQSFGARRLEQAVERLLLECLSPLGMQAMVEAARLHTEDVQLEQQRHQQRLERARYEVSLARRQYDAVDPENRLVAQELENRYEKALRTERDVQANVMRELDILQQPLNAEQEQLLERYAEDLQSLWRAPTTGAADRKRIVRCLIEAVVVSTPRDSSTLTAEVHWKGGKVTAIELGQRPHGRTSLCLASGVGGGSSGSWQLSSLTLRSQGSCGARNC